MKCEQESLVPTPTTAMSSLQFRRFQEVTLTHLQAIANNYNVSYNIDARFQSLVEESQAMALGVNRSQTTMQGDLAHLKTWMRKIRRRSRKVDVRLQALDLALSTNSRQQVQERKGQREAMARLALDMQALQDTLAGLTHQVHSQGVRLAALEGQLQMASPGTAAPGLTPVPTPTWPAWPGPGSLQLQRDRQVFGPSPKLQNLPQDFTTRLQVTQKPPPPSIHWAHGGAIEDPKDSPQLAKPHHGPGHSKCQRLVPSPPLISRFPSSSS
jgi:hypothetical protein